MSLRYFLQKDITLLKERIKSLQREIDEVADRIGEACGQGAETYHDNAPYEEAVRHKDILSKQLLGLVAALDGAYPVDPPKTPSQVDIGTKVVAIFFGDDEPTELIVGSFMNISGEENVVSYISPLGQSLLGTKPGDECRFTVGKREIKVKVLEVKPLEVKPHEAIHTTQSS